MFTILFSTLITFAQIIPVDDTQFGCVQKNQADKYIKDFNIDVPSFGGAELCNSNVDTKKLFNDLLIIEKGTFATFGNHHLIKGFVAADNYYSWMKSQTRGIDRGQDIPTATAYNSGGYFTMQDGWAQLSTLGRVGTVIHEARHTAGYRHMPCTFGPYAAASLNGCDKDYSYGGSHAVEMEYYARVSVLGQNFHPIYKKMARLMAVGRTNFVFNQSPIKKTNSILAIDEDGQAHLVNNSQLVARELPDADGVLKRTSFGASLFDGVSAWAVDIFELAKTPHATQDDYSYYKLLHGSTASLKDAEEIDLGSRRFFVTLNSANQISSYEFAKGQWSAPLKLNLSAERWITRKSDGQEGLFFLSDTGLLHQLDPVKMKVQATNDQFAVGTIKFIQLQQSVLRLDENGNLWSKDNSGEKIYPLFGSKKVKDIVEVPVYNAFEVL